APARGAPASGPRPLPRRAGRAPPRAPPLPGRGEPGLRLLRQVEPVGGQPHRVLPLGRVLEPPEHLAHAHEPFLTVGRALDLEAYAIGEVALRTAEQLLELRCEVGRVATRRQRDDPHVE